MRKLCASAHLSTSLRSVCTAASSFIILVPVIMTSVGGEGRSAKLKQSQQTGAGGSAGRGTSSSAFISVNVLHSSGAAAVSSKEQQDTLNALSSAPVLQNCARY